MLVIDADESFKETICTDISILTNHSACLDPPFIPWLIRTLSLMRSKDPADQAQRYPKQVAPTLFPPHLTPLVNPPPPQIPPPPLRRHNLHPPPHKTPRPHPPLPPPSRQIKIRNHNKPTRLPPLPPRNNSQIPHLHTSPTPRTRIPHRRTRIVHTTDTSSHHDHSNVL